MLLPWLRDSQRISKIENEKIRLLVKLSRKVKVVTKMMTGFLRITKYAIVVV